MTNVLTLVRSGCALVLCAALLPAPALSQSVLSEGKPEDVGMSSQILEEGVELYRAAVERGDLEAELPGGEVHLPFAHPAPAEGEVREAVATRMGQLSAALGTSLTDEADWLRVDAYSGTQPNCKR